MMKAKQIAEGVYWVGSIDWNVRNFHGYQTGRGSTYGAYLIIDDKTALIDTVKASFSDEMISRIRDVIPPEKIDIIISNHVEMDHSGALPAIRSLCPKASVYTSGASGVKGLAAHYGQGDYIPVKSGESISLGRRTLSFVATPMLHWPDNMVTYCPEEGILFSNDAFGQHLATSELFDDKTDLSIALEEAKKYYSNIIMCYGNQAKKAWDIVKELKPVMIAPSHGIVWRSHVEDILEAYRFWSRNEPETGAVIVYDSMWQSTKHMAAAIGEAFGAAGISVRIYDLKENHISNIMPDILTSKYLAVGSPTLNNQMLPTVSAFLCYLRGLSPKNREAFAFGSYGWGGQSIPSVEKELEACGFHICLDAVKINYVPTAKQLDEIFESVQNMLQEQGRCIN